MHQTWAEEMKIGISRKQDSVRSVTNIDKNTRLLSSSMVYWDLLNTTSPALISANEV